jgi:hypothetical protein
VKSSPIPNWWANDRVIVGTNAGDFDEVPIQPRAGSIISARSRGLDSRSHQRGRVRLAVASSDKWVVSSPYICCRSHRQGGRSVHPRTIATGIAIPYPADRNLDVQIDVKTAEAGEQLRASFVKRFEGEPIDISGEGERCRLQTTFDPKRIGSVLGRLIQGGQ